MNKTKKNRIIQNLIILRGNILFRFYYTIKRWGDFYFYGRLLKKTTVFEAKHIYEEDIQYNVLEEKLTSEVFIPEYLGTNCEKIVQFEIPDRYFAIIKECSIVGECECVLKDDYFILDLCCEKESYRYNLEHAERIYYKRNEKVKLYYNDSGKRYTKGILLCITASNNYFHFMFGAMTRLALINSISQFDDWPLFIDKKAYNISNLRELLGVINKTNRNVVVIDEGELCKVDDLLIISESLLLPTNVYGKLRSRDFRMDWDNALLVREACIDKITTTNNNTPRRIFVSRKSNRRIVNMSEIESIFIKYGFEIVYCEEMSFIEQVQLFNNAEFVAGPTGAALTNILFCNPGTKFICLIPKKARFYSYSTIAGNLGLKSIFVDGKITRGNRYVAAWEYSCSERDCENAIKQLM